MFSEYASKFLAQSQSRISNFGQPSNNTTTSPTDNTAASRNQSHDWLSSSRPAARAPGRSFLPRGYGLGPATQNPAASTNPYHPNTARLGGYGSRISAAQDAPLFRSVASDFRGDDDRMHASYDDDDDEHYDDDDDDDDDDREAADLLALQRSRRVAAASKLAESSETEGDTNRASLYDSSSIHDSTRNPLRQDLENSRTGGFRAGSWTAGRGFQKKPKKPRREPLLEEDEEDGGDGLQDSSLSEWRHGRSKGKMVDIGLESQIQENDEADNGPSASLLAESPTVNSPPAFQQFKPRSSNNRPVPSFQRGRTQESSDADDMRQADSSEFFDGPQGTDFNTGGAGAASAAAAAATTTMPSLEGELFRYDSFFAWSYLILSAALLSTFVLVWLHTSTPTGRIGDTIYTTLRASFHMLAVDTLVSIVVALFWLAALRSFVRPLVAMVVIGVPIILVSFSLYPFISSFQGSSNGKSTQDSAMRWAAFVPAISAVLWVYLVVRGRRSIQQAIEILDFSSRILAANSALLLLGLVCLGLIVVWTWIWLVMFNRIFLGGVFNRRLARFIISVSSWWIGAWFIFMYMWTIGVISSVQRAATAATVSQWYFHRNAVPSPSSRQIVGAAVQFSLTTIFGSICESTLLSLLVRTPLVLLPRRMALTVARFAALWIPTPVAALTNPLTITYAAIHSQSLAYSAKGLSQMDFLAPHVPTTTLTPRNFAGRRNRRRNQYSTSPSSPLLPYRLAKTILAGTRYVMATALGFAGWVITAKQLRIVWPDGVGMRGSAYAYIVGIVASFIGFSVMGAMEGILGGIVDAVVVCYGSERRMQRGGVGAYCMEAAYLFGDRRGGVAGFSDDDDDDDDEERRLGARHPRA